MNNKIPVLSAEINENSLLLSIDNNITFSKITPKEQMLVDSDQLAFIYIIEVDGEYTYLVINHELWPTLKEAIHHTPTLTPILVNEHVQIVLPLFYEEMTYLIDNIRGNSNYGEAMVEKVESTF